MLETPSVMLECLTSGVGHVWVWHVCGCGSMHVRVAVCMWVWQYECGCGCMYVGVAVCMWVWQYARGCGSMHVGVALTVGSETQPQYVQPPVIPGHEFIGEVVKLGAGESSESWWDSLCMFGVEECTVCGDVAGAAEKHGVGVGDHAIAENIVPCWECRYCVRGNYNMCK